MKTLLRDYHPSVILEGLRASSEDAKAGAASPRPFTAESSTGESIYAFLPEHYRDGDPVVPVAWNLSGIPEADSAPRLEDGQGA